MKSSTCLCNNTTTTAISTLSLHDALPICAPRHRGARGRRGERLLRPDDRQAHRLGRRSPGGRAPHAGRARVDGDPRREEDRKSTRLNSSHSQISYAVFCLKKKTTSNPPEA